MKVKQIATIMNDIVIEESLGLAEVQENNLDGIVTAGREIYDALGLDNYVKKLINHIGRVVFVDRIYRAKAPNVLMDNWEFGSIMEKIDCDMPELQENMSWSLQDGADYNQDIFKGPNNVRVWFFNDKTTYEIQISITEMQVKESFSNINQLNGFFSMIYTKINNRKELNNRDLTMRTINNLTAATIYNNFSDLRQEDGSFNFGNNSRVNAINLLGLFKEENPEHLSPEELAKVTPSNCISNLSFLKFASRMIALTSDRMEDMSTLFNIGKRQRFTPKDRQHLVLLSEFAKSADVYLQSSTFHEEYTKLPNAETVIYWQGSGTDYKFSSTSKIHISNKNFIAKGEEQANNTDTDVQITGVLGVLFDHDALGINNYNQRVPSHYNAKGEFVNYFYKVDARYFNDYNENFVVFFVA